MVEIRMLQSLCKPKIQLCWWHMRKAVSDQLDKKKLTTMPYNPGLAKSKFPFISLDFIPSRQADPYEHEGGVLIPSSMPGMIEAPHQKDPNVITICILALTPI